MNENDRSISVRVPVGFSSFICFLVCVLMAQIDEPLGKLLEVDWAVLLVEALIPILITFITLYRSCWHSEITGAARTLSLICLASIIYGSVMVAAVIIIVMVYLAYSTFFVGFSNFHY